jgi:hypothetical protein
LNQEIQDIDNQFIQEIEDIFTNLF